VKIETAMGAMRDSVGYMAYDHAGGSAVIIDAPFGSTSMFRRSAERVNLKVLYIVSTHGHWDQIAENAQLAELLDAPVCAHSWDMGRLANPEIAAEVPEQRLPHVRGKSIDRHLGDDHVLEVGEMSFEVLHTPGHTPGSICLYEAKAGALFSGDLLLRQEVGRSDHPGGNGAKLRQSLTRIATLPDSTRVFPAHGLPTTLGKERWLLELATIATT
jgi:glyoxylase-like metal-dependent hydrolase (beta-lactamase superfamily II)